MKARAICLILGVFIMSCSGCPGGTATSPELEAADKLFDDGTFEEAYTAYEAVYAGSQNEAVKWKAFHRSCESLSHLYRYGEAAQKLLDTPVPEKMPHGPRFLLLRAELLQSFLMQYSHVTSGDVVEDEGKEDVYRKTPDEIRAGIRGDYAALWDMREELADAPMSDEGYFFDVEGVHFGAYPTMLDYLVYSATDYLLGVEGSAIEEDKARPDAGVLIVEDFEREVSFDDPPALLAPALMEASGEYETKKRREAVERWKIKRLLLPGSHNLYEWGDEESNEKLRLKVLDLLLGWFTDFRTSGGKAEAGYQAAVIHESAEEYVEAVDMCKKVEDRYSKTYSSYASKVLRMNILEPYLNIEARTSLPPAKGFLKTETRNLDKVHFRAYAIDPDLHRTEIEEYSYYFSGWSGLFSYADRKWFEEKLLKRKPVESWSVETGDKGDHKYVNLEADAPELGKGVYMLLASESSSFNLGKVLVSYCFLNVTELVLVGTPGVTTDTRDGYYKHIDGKAGPELKDDVYRFYTLDARTGAPVDSAEIDVWATLNGEKLEFDLTSNAEGIAALEMKVGVEPAPASVDYYQRSNYYNHYGADPLARKDGSYAYWSSGLNVNYAPQNPITLFLETDRPIYRPGHEIKAKVIAVKRTPVGYRTLGKNRSVTFEALDPNGESFHTETVDLGEFGSAQTVFTVPKGRILGGYTLSAKVEDGQYLGEQSAWFQVEEYKQPEFEIEVDEAEKPWKYDKPVKIKGSVSYYFGGPVADANLKYVIRRSMYIPWYYRYWFTSDHDTGSEELATGEMKTDADGTFTIDFTPNAPPRLPYQRKLPDMASFTLEVEARDSGGRTIQGTQSFKAGKQALYFTVEPETEFFRAGEKAPITSRLMTMNDTPSAGSSTYDVFRLKNEPAKTLADLGYPRYGGQWSWTPPLDVQLAEVKSGKKVASGKATHGDDGVAALSLDALEPGGYRIVMKTKDEWGEKVEQEKVFVVAGEAGTAVPLHAASVTLAEKSEYEVGDEARFVIGSDLAAGSHVMELWAGEYFLRAQPVTGSGAVTVLDVPVTKDMKGGFTLRWFGLKDLSVHQGQLSVAVPWKEKKLTVSLDPFEEKLTPGQEATWGVKLADSKGQPVRGETLALMYDRALEYYVTSTNMWMDMLYLQAREPTSGHDSAFAPYVSTIYVEEGLLEQILSKIKSPPEPPKPPGVRTWETWAGGRPGGLFRSRGLLSRTVMQEKMDYAASPAPMSAEMEMDDETRAPAKKKVAKGAGKAENGRDQHEAPEVETRKSFADTAFF
ncbi:MAG: hypothetical protein JRG91_16155, partial [Deltaproteobacteria bacterium]|nr:hypothetical protein [Deltaproteobacteria bacterium]